VYKCSECGFVNKCFDKNDTIWCKKCDKYSSFTDDLEERCEDQDFTMEHERKLNTKRYDEHLLCKIKMNIGDVNYYGILEAIAVFEPNEWSSTPHDDYFFYYWLFTRPKERNTKFKKMLCLFDNSDAKPNKVIKKTVKKPTNNGK
jgi:hypothetical protein